MFIILILHKGTIKSKIIKLLDISVFLSKLQKAAYH